MSALGQKRTWPHQIAISALPAIADMAQTVMMSALGQLQTKCAPE
jgi:hypothetical protein